MKNPSGHTTRFRSAPITRERLGQFIAAGQKKSALLLGMQSVMYFSLSAIVLFASAVTSVLFFMMLL